MSHVEYGSYVHPDNEANLTLFRVIPLYTRRGFRWGFRNIARIEGELQATSQAAFQTAVNNLVAAYADNGNDFKFFDNDGNQTNHSILSSAPTAFSGTKIIDRDWPRSDGAEWATKRTYRITLQGDFVDTESDLVWWYEEIEHRGTAGAEYRMFEMDTSSPIVQPVHAQTKQVVIQRGTAVGKTFRPLHPGPILTANNTTVIEKIKQRNIVPISPRRERLAFYDYGVRWTYVFERSTGVLLEPSNGG